MDRKETNHIQQIGRASKKAFRQRSIDALQDNVFNIVPKQPRPISDWNETLMSATNTVPVHLQQLGADMVRGTATRNGCRQMEMPPIQTINDLPPPQLIFRKSKMHGGRFSRAATKRQAVQFHLWDMQAKQPRLDDHWSDRQSENIHEVHRPLHATTTFQRETSAAKPTPNMYFNMATKTNDFNVPLMTNIPEYPDQDVYVHASDATFQTYTTTTSVLTSTLQSMNEERSKRFLSFFNDSEE